MHGAHVVCIVTQVLRLHHSSRYGMHVCFTFQMNTIHLLRTQINEAQCRNQPQKSLSYWQLHADAGGVSGQLCHRGDSRTKMEWQLNRFFVQSPESCNLRSEFCIFPVYFGRKFYRKHMDMKHMDSNENKHVSTLYGIFPISLAYVIKSRCQYLPPPWGRGQLLWSQSATTELSQWHTFERIHFFCCWATIHRQEFATCENEMYSRTFAIFAYTEHTYPSAVRPRQRAGCKSVWFLVWVKWNAPIHK